jgi:integrase
LENRPSALAENRAKISCGTAKMKRIKTTYPGVFYRETKRIGHNGLERVYYIVFKKDGKLIEEKVGRQYVDDMTPARAAAIRSDRIEGKRKSRKQLRAELEEEKRAKESRWPLKRLWEAYTESRPDLKGIKTYKSQYDLWLSPSFGEKEPKEILQLDIDRLRIRMSKKKKAQTVKHVLSLLRRLVNFGVHKRYCDGLSFKIEMPKVNNSKTEDLSAAQLNRLLKAIDKSEHPQAGPMMLLALYTGMRRGELFRLKWQDIDFERGFIRILDPKGGQDQVIPLNKSARTLLEKHPKDSEYVFTGRSKKKRWFDIRKAVNEIKTDAGLPKDFRPLHGLRHVYASMLASSGEVDMYTLQKLLTHKSPQMTQRYAHLRDDTLKRAAELAGKIITEAAVSKKTDDDAAKPEQDTGAEKK